MSRHSGELTDNCSLKTGAPQYEIQKRPVSSIVHNAGLWESIGGHTSDGIVKLIDLRSSGGKVTIGNLRPGKSYCFRYRLQKCMCGWSKFSPASEVRS